MNPWLRKLVRRFSDWLYRLGGIPEKDREASGDLDLEKALGMEAEVEDESRPVLRLSPDQLGIFVQCSVCAVLHELDAVCYRCGSPLCSDEDNCRKTHYVPEMGQSAVICAVCVGN